MIPKDERIDRRTFLQAAAGLVAGAAAALGAPDPLAEEEPAPRYLSRYTDLLELDPARASRAWFADSGLGLLLHFGLYSMLGRGEWTMYNERISVADYSSLAEHFYPDRFDADRITDLALDAGMRYVNITARHYDGFCLFDSQYSEFTSARSSARRDLVAELSTQCQAKGLGLFVYYSYALDWRHPYFYSRELSTLARPNYTAPDPEYKWRRDADFHRYVEFIHAQLGELLSSYGPIAGVWLDPVLGYFAKPELFPIRETYAMIRRVQPQCLVTFNQGVTGTEDFAALDRDGQSLAARVAERFQDPSRTTIAERAWEANKAKHNEVRESTQPGAWGYTKASDGVRRGADEVWALLDGARNARCNLLLNTGLLGDGALHDADTRTLREVGRRIRAEGWPARSAPQAALRTQAGSP